MNVDDLIARYRREDAGPKATEPASNPLLERYRQEDRMLNAFATASKTNPDEYARLRKKAIDAGMTPEQVDMFPEEAERRARYDEAVRLAQQSPKTAKWLAVEDNAKLGQDNADNLSAIETLWRSMKRGFMSGLRGQDAVEMTTAAEGLNTLYRDERGLNEPMRPRRQTLTASPQTIERIRGQYARLYGENSAEFQQRSKRLEGLAPSGALARFYGSDGWGDALGALARNPVEIATNVAAESIGTMAPGMPAIVAGGLLGGPVGLAAATGETSRQVEYASAVADYLQAAGIDLNDINAVRQSVGSQDFREAKRKAGIKSATIGAFDAATAGLAGVRLRPSMAGNLAAQAGVQAAGGAAGEAAGSVLSGQEINAASVLAEAIGEMPGAVVDVATLAGRRALRGIGKADAAEKSAAFLENLNQLAAADKVLARDPETFQSFIAAAAEDGPVDTIYIDGRTLMQSGMAPKLAEFSPSVREQLDRAILTGGDIAIPVDEYAARIAPTDAAPALLDHLRTEADGFTRAEATAFMESRADEMQAEVERALTDAEGTDAFRASQDAVKADLLGQLNAAGRFTPQVNEAYASLASAYTAVRAAQLGITPEEFHNTRGMKVRGVAMDGQRYDQAGFAPTEQATAKWREAMSRISGDMNYVPKMDSPAVLRAMGERSAQIAVPSRVIQQIGRDHPDVPLGVLERMPELLSDPLFVLPHREGGLSVVLDAKTENGALLVAGVRDGKLRTITPLDDAEGGRLASWIERAMQPGGKVYARNKEAIVKTMASTSAPDRADSVEALPRSGVHFITRDALVKRLGGGFYQSGSPAIDAIVQGWKTLASVDDVFQHALPDSFDMERAATEINAKMRAEPFEPDLDEQKNGIVKKWIVTMPDGTHAYVTENNDREVWIDASRLEEGVSGGTRLYLLVGSYAEGNDRVFIGDPAGLSDVALIRRTENMLSLALRFGRTGFMRPHPYQMAPGDKQGTVLADVARPLEWVEGDDANNIAELLRTSYTNTTRLVPEIKDVYYNFDTRQFERDGKPVTDDDFAAMRKRAAGDLRKRGLSAILGADTGRLDGATEARPPIGSATLKRTAIVNTLAREAGGGRGRSVLAALDRVVHGGLSNTGLQGLLYQPDGGTQAPRGAFNPATNTVALLQNADLSTFLHESAHYFFENDIAIASELVAEARAFGLDTLKPGERQIVDDVSSLLEWHGIHGNVEEQLRQWHTMDFEEQRTHHERTAESFEAYLFSGRAPNLELQPIFQRFRAWMVSVYKSLKDFLSRNPEAGKLNDEVRGVFDRMIATQEQITLAEQARSMLPLFQSPDEIGMTPDAFAEYQSQGVDATSEAIEALQAKGLRDMQWLHNARGREVKRLKRESRALRAEAEIEARREVMSQPVYRAWDFLTRKITQSDELPVERKSDPNVVDPTIDSLFVAIAKLGGVQKAQVLSEWGVDPKDIPESDLFGKPVWRIKDGLTLDGMAEALAQHGYLPLDADGKYELNDFADRFLAELAGTPQHADAYVYDDPGVANPAGLEAGRLDLGALAAMGVDEAAAQRLKDNRMTAKTGLHPDLVAELFDFTSGDELVRALAAAERPRDAVNALADQIMLERHGELATEDAIELAADAAIHNAARAKMLTTEANALAAATGQPKLLAAAARAFAADAIAGLRVRDVRPVLYSRAAERAARAAEKARKSGDTAQAAAEKRNQVLQVTLADAAHKAREEVESAVRYLRRFDKPSKTLDPDYQDQIDALLERFELRPASLKAIDRRASFAQWIEAQREAGLEPDVPPELENEAFRTHYKDMTVEEFRGLVDTVRQIEHLGRLKHKLLAAQDRRAFGAIVSEVSASIVEHGGKASPVKLEGTNEAQSWLAGFVASHRKIASLARQMDGGADNGPLWRVLVRPMNERGALESSMNEQATRRLMELYKPMLALKGGLNGDKRAIPEIGASLTRGGRLAVALNWGNAANRQRVMDGDGWSEYQVEAILSTLSKDEWTFVQSVWDFIDSYWPDIAAKEKRVTGRAPEKVEALPFTRMVDGETIALRGGYYPLKYDAERSDRTERQEAAEVAKDMLRGAITRATTRRGHTKARVESLNRPVRKSLDVITEHVAQVTHDLAWHEWLIDANRLLNAGAVTDAIRDHYGPEVIKAMRDMVAGIAAGDAVPRDATDRLLLHLRANVSRSTMGVSMTTAMLQPFGLSQSMVRIGTKHVLRGMARWAGDAARFESSMGWIAEKSEFMRLRGKTFNRELHEIKGRVSKGHSKARQIYDASLFLFMQKMQLVADVPTWIGAYEKAVAQNHDEATAVALADQAVLDAQGGGQVKDLSEIQRKHPWLTMFYSYFNTTANLVAESTAKTDFKNPLAVAGWLTDMALLVVVPALAPALVLSALRGEDCGEPDECAAKLTRDQLGFLLNTVVGVREFSGSVQGYDYAGPPVGRVISETGRFATQVKQGEADEALARSSVSLLGVTLGIPTTQIIRSWRGWQAWAEDDAPASAILFGPPPKD